MDVTAAPVPAAAAAAAVGEQMQHSYKMEAEAAPSAPNSENTVAPAKLDNGVAAPDVDTMPKIDLAEAQGVLAAMALTSVTVGEYLVVLRSQFDVFITGEPYPALMILFNLTSGKVLARIWNQGSGQKSIHSITTLGTIEEFPTSFLNGSQ